jgi:hypothetical protein
VYKKPVLKDLKYYDIINRNKIILSSIKLKILKKVLKLRDEIARMEVLS